jgi:predicted phosphodiesterase
LALEAIAHAGVDLLLAGHNHRASTHHARDLVTEAGPALVVQAGTATSTRLREEAQSFNLIEIGPGNVAVTVECWDGTQYRPTTADRFIRRAMHWETASGEELAEAPQA